MADLTTPSVWSGSEYTKKLVKNVIAQRWGESEAEQYDPQTNCFTFKGWLNKGYTVKKGEKAIRSIIQTEENESTETGKPANKPTILPVFLFYYKQVTKLAS